MLGLLAERYPKIGHFFREGDSQRDCVIPVSGEPYLQSRLMELL